MKKLLYIFLGIVIAVGMPVWGLSVFQVIQGGTGATSFTIGNCLKGNGTGAVTDGACGSGTFPFTSVVGYNSTSTTVGFFNGIFATASSTFSSNLYLSSLSQGFAGIGTNGLLYTFATSSIKGSQITNDSGWTSNAGTVTAVSVASANGLAGSSSGGATPALTLSTTITSNVLKGNGTAISGAVNGTDYTLITALDCTGLGHLLKVTAAGVFTCGADSGGGGGGAGGTFSTSTVVGNINLLNNYANNATDVVEIGGTAGTSTAKAYFDPNGTQFYQIGNASTASTSIFGLLSLPNYTQGNLYVGSKGLLQTSATSSIASGVGITVTNGTTAYVLGAQPSVACNTANTSTFGCLTSADWNTFNTKPGFPFTVNTGYNSTTSTIGFITGGLFSTASSTFSSSLFLPSLTQGNLYTGTNGLVQTAATSSETCTSPLSCTSFDVLKNGGAITLGTVTVAKGGTNQTSYPINSIITSDSAGTSLIATGTQLTVGNILATTTAVNQFNGVIVAPDGTLANPAFSFSDDQNNGIYSPANDIFAILTNGIERFRINDSSGYSSFGTTTEGLSILTLGTSTAPQLSLSDNTGGDAQWTFRNSGANLYMGLTNTGGTATTTTPAVTWRSNGNEGLGTSTPPSNLTLGATSAQLVSLNPLLLFGTSTLASASANGTYMGINSPTGFTGDYLHFQNNGTTGFKVSQATNGVFALGTSTFSTVPGKLVIATTTTSQITLQGNPGEFPVNIRSIGSSFFIATSSVTSPATTTLAALGFNSGGQIIFGNYPTCNGTGNALGVTSSIVTCDSLVSDIRLKKDIEPITNGLSTVLALNPVSFYWKDLSNHNTTDPRQQFGFIAQDVAKVIPSAVGDSPDGYKTLDKTAFISPMIDAIKSLWRSITDLIAWNKDQDKSLKKLEDENAQMKKDMQKQIDELRAEIKNLKK